MKNNLFKFTNKKILIILGRIGYEEIYNITRKEWKESEARKNWIWVNKKDYRRLKLSSLSQIILELKKHSFREARFDKILKKHILILQKEAFEIALKII